MERAAAVAGPSLVGRKREFAALWEQFAAAAAGRVRAAFVAGEPGSGKTRLLDAIAARAHGAGATVLRGGASDAEGMPPYLPFLEALGRHIRTTTPEKLREQAGDAAPVLATILPELAARLGALPPRYPLPPEQARLRLYEAVADFLGAVAVAQPLVLILDDLHWADPATLDLLCFAARHLRPEEAGTRLLILGAYREGEVAHRPAFERARIELTRLRLLTTVIAGPLAASEVAALAGAHLGTPPSAALAALLAKQSEGNPFFAEELLRGWLELGALSERDGHWHLAGTAPATLPPGIAAAIGQRIARLTPETAALLDTAAIIGRTFDTALLAAVAERDPEAVEADLREAVAAHLLRPADTASFAFVHDTIRECLYADVTALRRRRLHGAIGLALEATATPHGPQRLAELAFQFGRSGDRARGADYAERAAEAALRASAPLEALAHYRAAVALHDADDARRGALLAALGETALLTGEAEEAATAFAAAQALFERADRPIDAARMAQGLGRAHWHREMIPQALAAFEAARDLLADRPLPETVEVLVDLSGLLTLSLHRQDEGLRYARQALALARQLEEGRLVASASRALGNLLVRTKDLRPGIALMEEALALAVELDDPIEAAECCAGLRMSCGWAGQFGRALAFGRREIAFAQHCRMPALLRHVYPSMSILLMLQGDMAEAERLLALARPILERLGNPEASTYLHWIEGGVYLFRGDHIRAEQRIGAAVATFRSLNPSSVVWFGGLHAFAQAKAGLRQAALHTLDEIEAQSTSLPAGSMPLIQVLSWVGETALTLGDHERLLRLEAPLAPFRDRWLDRPIARLLGTIETLRGDFAAAEASLAAAEATVRAEGVRWDLAILLNNQADLALARGGSGDVSRARALLGEAQGIYRDYGNTAEVQRMQERLRSLPTQPGARPTAPRPAGLSHREVEVLRLLAAGQSNREIAANLHLSESTVAHHLTSIYTKTGVDNRSAATAYAIRHGLA